MHQAARRRILLVDHSKFGRESLCRHGKLSDIDLLITDSGVSRADLKALDRAGVRVEIAAQRLMITTVTPNPSMDRTLHLTTFTRGAVNRVHRVMVEPSGKGINVALALQTVGRDVTAVLPVGGPSGRALIAMLDAAGLAHRDVPITGAIRTNVSLIEADGTTSKVNEPGPEVSAKDIDDLIAAALTVSSVGEWVAWCGSLPTGFGESMLADALAHTHSVGRRVALDSSGPALRTALDLSHDQLPHLIKPNADELAELVDECSPRWAMPRMQQRSWFAAAWKPYWSAWVETVRSWSMTEVALHGEVPWVGSSIRWVRVMRSSLGTCPPSSSRWISG